MPTSLPIEPGLLVLGMHRSGTSCLAGMLQSGGFTSGVVDQWNADNQCGNRENPEVVRLNEAVLRANGGGWESPPSARPFLAYDDSLRARRDAILQRVAAEGRPWLLKDPRLLLLLPFWRETVPNPRRIGIFRDPFAVAISLYVRSRKPIAEGLRLWLSYNRELLSECDRKPFPILCFDRCAEAFQVSVIRALEQECSDLIGDGRIDPEASFAFYHAELIHHRASEGAHSLDQVPLDAQLLADVHALHHHLLAVSGVTTGELSTVGRLDGGSALNLLFEADRAVALGDLERAVECYRGAAAVAADPPAVWMRLIETLREAGDEDRAWQAARDGVSACPSDPSLLMNVSVAAKEAGAVDEAIAHLQKAVVVAPRSPLCWLRLGELLCDVDRWAEGTAALRRAIAMQPPGHFWAHARLGQALLQAGERGDGDEAFRRAIDLAPQSGKAAIGYRWAQSLLRAGDRDAALQRQREAAGLAARSRCADETPGADTSGDDGADPRRMDPATCSIATPDGLSPDVRRRCT